VIVCPATVIVPVRAASVVLAATLKLVEPRPVIDAPLVIVIQAALLVAVHAQLDPVVTATLPLVPVDGAFTVVGDTVNEQLSAAWLTVTVWPAIVIVPVRAAPVVLAATVKLLEPRPVMVAPLVIVIQAALLVAVHAQLEPVVTDTLAFVPVDGAFTAVGDTVNVQLFAAWFTVTV
jgi:hypothetical protein